MGIELAIGALAIGTAAQAASSIVAGKEQRKATRARQRIEARQTQRQQLAELRQSQIVRASVSQQAATSGTADTSGFRGAISSAQSTTAGNIAFTQQVQGLQQYIGNRLEQANKIQTIGTVVGQVADTTAQIALAKK